MAVLHIGVNPNTVPGARLLSILRKLESGIDELADEVATMALMIDGDSNEPTSYDYMQAKYGFASGQAAHDGYFEMLSLDGKFPNDPSTQVSAVKAAINQASNKFR